MRRPSLHRLAHITVSPLLFWAVLALSIAAPLLWIVDAPVRALEAPFREQQARWERLEPKHYRYEVAVRCFCALPASESPQTVEVRDGVVVSVRAVRGTRAVDLSPRAAVRIADVFSRLIDAAADRPERFEVEYDQTFGFPARVWIDPLLDVTDEHIGFTITKFRVLQ